ncbi:hypothetical protein [Thalassoroseus pseudoceratinae]|uniref:hypothetical protein n=1 Tax=Thalassoroseus pseudoceratinae TaxID=2713176 RepID=UPI00141E5C06|nr:hypothetical protein [Thalassoroseus pseudoceratinae]
MIRFIEIRNVRLIPATLAVCLCGMLGCGGPDRPERVPVSGQVLIDGEPLTVGSVQILPENARAANGKIDSEGRFEMTTFEPGDGVVPGTHRVVVVASEAMGGTGQKWHAPKKYIDPTQSGLTVEITEPTDSLEINLSWDGGKPFVEKFDAE